jgi:hypothetical protein
MMKFYLEWCVKGTLLKVLAALGVWVALTSGMLTQTASGQVTRTWASTTGGVWTVQANWAGNQVPDNGDDVVFNNVDGTITNIPPGTFVRDFIKTGTGTVTIENDIQIQRNLSVGAGGGFTSTATVTLNGTGPQNVGGAGTTQFNNLTVNNDGTFVTTVFPAAFTVNNITDIVGNITVTGTMAVLRGAVSFCSDNNVTRNHTINTLSLGSASSTVTISLPTVTVNTAIAINNAVNSNCTVTVTGDFIANATYSDPTIGGVSLGLASPNCNGGSATLDVQGNFNAPSRIGIVCNGRLAGYSSGSVGSMTFSVGTLNTANTGNFIITNTNSRFNGNGPGTTTPNFILRGGTTANPATYNVPYVVFTGLLANASTRMDIDGVYNVVDGSSVAIAAVPARRLRINGTLIVEDGGEIAGADVGAGSTSPRLEMGPNGRLVVRDPSGLGNGSSATPFAFCITRRTAPNNWDLTSISSNGTIEYNGTALQTITARNPSTAPNTQYHRLTISGANKTLESTNGSVVVNDQLTLQGGIVNRVNATDVVQVLNNATGAVTRTSGHINARLQRAVTGTSQTYLFPIGDNTTYREISLTLTSSGNSSLRAELIDGNANSLPGVGVNSPLQKVSDLRYYSFLNTGTNNVTILQVQDMAINADDAVKQASPNNTLKIATRVSGNWQSRGPSSPVNTSTSNLPTTFTSDIFTESVDANSTFSTFFVSLGTTSPTDDPLPVELVGFKGEATVLGVVLEWQTASERDNAGFVLMRNGEVIADYREHAALRGAGTSAVGRRYRFIDERVREGERYVYALRSVDFDGTVHDYAVRVEVEGRRVSREYELMQNYPNPFNPVTTIRYVLPEESEVRVRVYDMLGRMVKEVVGGLRQGAGVYEVRFEGSGLGSGVYVYRLEAVGSRGRYVASKKMVLMK